jgi:hypothetical protein
MAKRLNKLGIAAIAAALMAVSAQAATGFDLTTGHGGSLGFPEPATMMVLGMVLLATFRGSRPA